MLANWKRMVYFYDTKNPNNHVSNLSCTSLYIDLTTHPSPLAALPA